MESSEMECVRAGFGMFAESHMRVPHYHSLYLLTDERVYGNGDTSIESIKVERNTKV
jgi:hypothetical protein